MATTPGSLLSQVTEAAEALERAHTPLETAMLALERAAWEDGAELTLADIGRLASFTDYLRMEAEALTEWAQTADEAWRSLDCTRLDAAAQRGERAVI